jgi:O-antigen ligase
LAIVQRFSGDELDREKEDGRSAIWDKGFNQMFSDNPILGLGFRNFGEVGDASDPNSPTVVLRKDNAHGFFQEVFVEHGVVLGILMLVSFFYTLFKFRVYSQNDLSEFNALFFVMIAFFVTSFFSGSFLNGIGYFYLGVFIYHIPKLNVAK